MPDKSSSYKVEYDTNEFLLRNFRNHKKKQEKNGNMETKKNFFSQRNLWPIDVGTKYSYSNALGPRKSSMLTTPFKLLPSNVSKD